MLRPLIIAVFFALPASAHDQPTYRFRVDRVIDADTIRGTLYLPRGLSETDVDIRLQCIQSPESRGRNKTPEGKMLAGLVAHWIEGRDILVSDEGDGGFGRILGNAYPPGWNETLSQRLYRLHWWHSPLYEGSQTTQAAIEACRREMNR